MRQLPRWWRPRPPQGIIPSGPPPCFNWPDCKARAAVEKAGRSVCQDCAGNLKGAEYPLRMPTIKPLYSSGFAAAEALDMVEVGSD